MFSLKKLHYWDLVMTYVNAEELIIFMILTYNSFNVQHLNNFFLYFSAKKGEVLAATYRIFDNCATVIISFEDGNNIRPPV